MATVVFNFQVHQPYVLRPYSVFDESGVYFDDNTNASIAQKTVEKCYRPATTLLLELIQRHEGNFRVSFSISGTALEQFQRWAPDVVELFGQLIGTGCCELLAETSHHSLSCMHSREEFEHQIRLHRKMMQDVFDVTPRVFRNTELMYSDEIAHVVSGMLDDAGEPMFDGMLCVGVDRFLKDRSPSHVYKPPLLHDARCGAPFGLLLKQSKLSDDIALRFSDRSWEHWPLTAEGFARWVHAINPEGYLCNLFMNFETFGKHQSSATGIFDFLNALPEMIFDISPGENHFCTPSEALAQFSASDVYDVPEMTSWADTHRDTSAWLGNDMQTNAQKDLYRLKPILHEREDEEEAEALISLWRKLTTSDHAYYMSTNASADGDVCTYFNPYDSPYDAYINFMNVLGHLRKRLERQKVVIQHQMGEPSGL